MIVYSSTKKEFLNDVNNFPIEDVILKKFEERLKRTTGQSEIESWRDSLPFMSQVLTDATIPDDAGILIEFMIPQSSFRVDFIITGLNKENKENVVIIELKRWTEIELTEKDGIVKTRFKGGLQDTSHPSYQAWSYAAYLNSFNETIFIDDIKLNPCAYLHNYVDDGKISNRIYQHYIDISPIFLKSDKQKLRDFIKSHVKKGDTSNIMYRIENSKIRPSKALADCLVSMLKNKKEEFIMLDDQKLVYETAISISKKSNDFNKNVLIVEGGPGTGKSVVAINLLVGLNKIGKVAKYVTKNGAPRAVYKAMLTGSMRGGDIDFLFTGSGSFINTEPNTFDTLIVDEAHRLNAKSGMFSNLGENQIKEIIGCSKFSIFFIDEDQKVTTKDIGNKDEINKWAKFNNANVVTLELRSQFRCNGSDGYLAWLDNMLQIRNTSNILLEKKDYSFNVLNNPSELRDIIYSLNENNKSRMLAGYCWKWVSKKDRNKYDIEFPKFDFKHKWNLADDGMKFIISKESVSEIGCIHTSQGLELEHVGVIVGKDLVVRNGKVVTNFRERDSNDSSLKGIVALNRTDPEKAYEISDRIIKNTYRTLFTRGMKSCHVYFVDEETRDYFSNRIAKAEKKKIKDIKQPAVKIIPFENSVPIYDLKAAASVFSELQIVNIVDYEWIELPSGYKASKDLFACKVLGESMNKIIPNGSTCLFRRYTGGSRNGKIVLAEHTSKQESEFGSAYTVKEYYSKKKIKNDLWSHESIKLKPKSNNPEFTDIELSEDESINLKVIAIFECVLR